MAETTGRYGYRGPGTLVENVWPERGVLDRIAGRAGPDYVVERVYCDGGVLAGGRVDVGSIGWTMVGPYGTVAWGAGVLTIPLESGGVTNNLTELLAMLTALDYVPDDWRGEVCSDSMVTIGRMSRGWKLAGVPREWRARIGHVLRKISDATFTLHKGHPTRRDVERGFGCRCSPVCVSDACSYGKDMPVSAHQDFCDDLCNQALADIRNARRDAAR